MAVVSDPHAEAVRAELLKPYVPRLLIEWVRESPGTQYLARDGSLAFVDISGFTALTERLSRRGKIGAELLRDALDGVFGALLDEAYAWGAGLLKWGGDALLLLFDGPGHPERAARAAWEMQGAIERAGRIRVGGTTVTLRMSVGITTGTIEFFTAGSVHRELLVVGPAATETVAMESIADAGEVALSAVLAAQLAPECVGGPKADAFLLAAPPAIEPGAAPDVGPVGAAEVASCIPLAAREHVLLERSEPEHRLITAAFFDLMRTDEMLARLGPAAFAAALDERISAIEEAAARYEVPFNVTDVSKGSVKVLLTAGAPSTTGHDEEQVLRLVREVMDREGAIPMRVGVNSGRVFTGDFGPPYRRTYAVLGDAINTAARVMARAEAGQILATDPVLERSRTTFSTVPVEPFRAKGKAELVRASAVGAIAGRRSARVDETPFVGRQRVLAALSAVLGEVRSGTGWTVEIAGASGIGKTRLLREVLAAAPHVRVLRSTCEEYEASTPYYALREPTRDLLGLDRESSPVAAERRLRKVVAETDPRLAGWIPLLGILLGLQLPPTPETAALDERFISEVLADVTLRFLVAALGGATLALVVEDAQFMDEASAALLRRLSRSAGSLPHLLVIAGTHEKLWTDTTDESSRFLVFQLLPLAVEEAVALVESLTDDKPLRPHEVEELVRRSGGSPLFLIELLNLARASGTDALPESVEAVATAAIDRLSASDRIVLRHAAVLGVTFAAETLAATIHDEALLDAALWERLRGLVDRDSEGQLRFRNSLVRDAAYEGLPFRRRRELHARVAEAIEATAASLEQEAATLALHFSMARRHERTWQYGRLGGDRARAVAANVEAARLYEFALAAGRHVRSVSRRDRAEVLVQLGVVQEIAGLFDQSFEAFRRATTLLPDDAVERARIASLRTRARVRTGPWALALRECTAGLRLVEGREEPEAVAIRARLHGMRSEIRMFQGRANESIRLAQLAVEEAEQVGELEALVHAYVGLDGSYQLLGQPEKAVHEHMSLEIHEKLGHIRARGVTELNLGVQAYADGRWQEAEALYESARDDLLRAGDRHAAAHAGSSLGELLISRGRLDEAEHVLRDSRRVLRSSSFAAFAVFAEVQLARCRLERGDLDAALGALERIAPEASSIGHAPFLLETAVYLAHAHARAGSPEAGLDALASATAEAGDEAALYVAAVERARAACLVAAGRTDEAAASLERALAAADAQKMLYEQLLARRALSTLAGRGSAEELREIERLARLLGLEG